MLLLALMACNPAPEAPEQGVGYRNPADEGPQSGERGNIAISEILWSGSVDADGNWDPTDVFVELRNEGTFPIDLSQWRLLQEGSITREYRIPDGVTADVGEHVFLAAKTSGCFPEPDGVLEGLRFVYGDPFELTLMDFDERLIEPAGSTEATPFAGGWDGKRSRSMEKVELMFGGEGNLPHAWHYHTKADVEVPNDDRMAAGCTASTWASPGRPNSPDYSGAYASGSLE
jgi:hypothetical protein